MKYAHLEIPAISAIPKYLQLIGQNQVYLFQIIKIVLVGQRKKKKLHYIVVVKKLQYMQSTKT